MTQQYCSVKAPQLPRRVIAASGYLLRMAFGTNPAKAGRTGVMPNARMRARIFTCSSGQSTRPGHYIANDILILQKKWGERCSEPYTKAAGTAMQQCVQQSSGKKGMRQFTRRSFSTLACAFVVLQNLRVCFTACCMSCTILCLVSFTGGPCCHSGRRSSWGRLHTTWLT